MTTQNPLLAHLLDASGDKRTCKSCGGTGMIGGTECAWCVQPAPEPARPAFEAWLKTVPDARFWNTTDAMLAAFIGGRAELQAARAAETEGAAKDSLPLQLFMDAVIGEFPEHGDLDAITLQEMAEACGLLKEETAVVPCGENCACAEYLPEGKEVQCYRVQPVMRSARIASARHDAAIRAAEESK